VRPTERGVRGAGDEAVWVEERAHAPECDAHGDRHGDAGPARHGLPGPAAAAHQGELPPTGHLPQARQPPRSSRGEWAGGGGGRAVEIPAFRRSFWSRRRRHARFCRRSWTNWWDSLTEAAVGWGPSVRLQPGKKTENHS
jgi:hypothetical protein